MNRKILVTATAIGMFAFALVSTPTKQVVASEGSGTWKKNLKMGSVKKEDGGDYVWLGLPVDRYVWVKKYKYLDCCISATDSDACNTGAQSSGC